MYAYVKYVYEALKNGQTVIIAAQRHGLLSNSIKAYYQLEPSICCGICDFGSLTLGSIQCFNLTSKDSGVCLVMW